MELKVYDITNKEIGKQKMPSQFSEAIRLDLIKRTVEAIQSHRRQRYGADPMAGKRAAATLSRRRRKYKGSYGKGISRVPRKTLMRRGEQMIWVGAFAPGTVKGRRAHPPKAERGFSQKINDKERRKAIRSALAATIDKKIVEKRGHKIPAHYPFILATDFENVSKTKDVAKALNDLGLAEDLARGSRKHVRAGKGTMRGRRYQKAKGPLLVVSDTCKALTAAKSIPGVDIVKVGRINAELLAPGSHAGRLTIFTQAALEKLTKDKLFM